MRKPLVWWAAGLLLGLGLPTTVWAQEELQVGVFPVQPISRDIISRQDLNTISSNLLRRVNGAKRYKAAKAHPLVGSKAPKRGVDLVALEKEKLAPLRAKMQEIMAKLNKQEYEKAIPLLKKALRLGGVKLIKWPSSVKSVLRIYGLLALSYFQMGESENGEKWIRNLAALQPESLPKEVKRYRQLRFQYQRMTKRLTLTKGSLQIKGSSGAKVYLNGRYRGDLPLTLQSIPNGFHYLQVRKAGFYPWGEAILAKAVGNQQVKVELKSAGDNTPSAVDISAGMLARSLRNLSFDSDTFRRSLKVICLHSGAQVLLSGRIEQGDGQNYSFTPVRFDCGKRTAQTRTAVEVDNVVLDPSAAFQPKVASFVENKQAKVAILRPKPPVERRKVAVIRRPPVVPPKNDPKTTPVYKKWWFWTTIAGVAVVGGGTAAAIILTRPPKVDVTVQLQAE